MASSPGVSVSVLLCQLSSRCSWKSLVSSNRHGSAHTRTHTHTPSNHRDVYTHIHRYHGDMYTQSRAIEHIHTPENNALPDHKATHTHTFMPTRAQRRYLRAIYVCRAQDSMCAHTPIPAVCHREKCPTPACARHHGGTDHSVRQAFASALWGPS